MDNDKIKTLEAIQDELYLFKQSVDILFERFANNLADRKIEEQNVLDEMLENISKEEANLSERKIAEQNLLNEML